MEQKMVQVTVARYNPDQDEAPYDQGYQVPVGEFTCVLDVLDYIAENLDSTLAYYDHAACQHGICRRCTLMVNGELCLMCQTLVTGDLQLAPPVKFGVVRDLVYSPGGNWNERNTLHSEARIRGTAAQDSTDHDRKRTGWPGQLLILR